jgi:hypothetical protein
MRHLGTVYRRGESRKDIPYLEFALVATRENGSRIDIRTNGGIEH